MDFRFDEGEQAVIAGAAGSLGHHLPIDRFRSSGTTEGAWAAIAADGWLDAAIPSEDGGLELPEVMQVAIAREAGRQLCVEEWATNASILPALMAAIPDDATRREWLSRRRSHRGALLQDGRSMVIEVADATVPAAPMAFGMMPGDDVYRLVRSGDATVLVRLEDARISLTPTSDLAIGVGRVEVDGGRSVEAPCRVGAAELERISRHAALIQSAGLIGLGEEAERRTVEYVKARKQFGVPIGQFQALKHILADVHVANEVAWNSVLHAALKGDQEPTAFGASRIQAVEAALGASRAMLQLHGGFGFTWEADVHYFLKTAACAAARFGSLDRHAIELGRALAIAS
jgi:acyl-CoA dehydrogenase